MLSALAPGPLIVRLAAFATNAPVVRVMVLQFIADVLNVTVSALTALATAERRLPAPLSAQLLTVCAARAPGAASSRPLAIANAMVVWQMFGIMSPPVRSCL